MAAPALETGVLRAWVAVVTFFELGAFLRRAIGFGFVAADTIFPAAIYRAWVSVVTSAVIVTIFRAIDGKMDTHAHDRVTAVCRASVVVVTVSIYDAKLSAAG